MKPIALPRCADCGQPDLLNKEGICPSCATERLLDLEQHYEEEK